MKLSIIIVTWNVRDYLLKCLESLYENKPSDAFEIIVVDNASLDGTAEAVNNNFSDVMLVASSENRGFATANNLGMKHARGEYILFLNPDTIVHSAALDTLISFMDLHSDIGVCGPKLLNDDGTVQRSVRSFPSFRAVLHRHTAFKFLNIFKGDYKKWVMKGFRYDEQMDVDQVMGAALMTRRAIAEEVGGMDESFFMFYEEVDFCYRIKQAGWRIVYTPQAVITHLGGRSTGQIPAAKRIMAMASLLKFFRKYRSRTLMTIFSCIFKPAIIIRGICDIIAGVFDYLFSVIVFNNKKRLKSAARVRNSVVLLGKYWNEVLFKM